MYLGLGTRVPRAGYTCTQPRYTCTQPLGGAPFLHARSAPPVARRGGAAARGDASSLSPLALPSCFLHSQVFPLRGKFPSPDFFPPLQIVFRKIFLPAPREVFRDFFPPLQMLFRNFFLPLEGCFRDFFPPLQVFLRNIFPRVE